MSRKRGKDAVHHARRLGLKRAADGIEQGKRETLGDRVRDRVLIEVPDQAGQVSGDGVFGHGVGIAFGSNRVCFSQHRAQTIELQGP